MNNETKSVQTQEEALKARANELKALAKKLSVQTTVKGGMFTVHHY